MASATFTLKAQDQTRSAFASVQNSLQRLEQQTKGIAKITKLAFGGEAVLGALNMMKQRLDKVIESGDELGFNEEQIGSALQFEAAINGVLNMLTQIPLALAKIGIEIKNAFSPLTKEELDQQIAKLRADRFSKELKASAETLKGLREEYDRIGMTEGQLADDAVKRVELMRAEADMMRSRKPVEAAKKEEEAQRLLNEGKKASVTLDKELKAAQDELNKSLGEAQSIGLARADLIAGLQKRYFELAENVTRLRIEAQAFEEVGAPANATKEKIILLTKEQTAVQSQLNKLLQEESRFAKQAGETTAAAFEDAIIAGSNLRDTIRGLAQDLLLLILRQQITEPLAKALGASTFFSSIFGGARAGGGPVGGGKAYMVGERGPELFVPNASGSIIPNHRLTAGAPNGTSVTVNYNIAAGVSRSELAPILESERRRLKAEIPDMVRRGGAYRAAFA